MNGFVGSLGLRLPWWRDRVAPPGDVRPVVRPERAPLGRASLLWIFSRTDDTAPAWIDGYQYPITAEDAEALVGVSVSVHFQYAFDEHPDGSTSNYRPMMVTITDKNSDLEVHERTFPLAADAFIVAAKRMRLDSGR